MPRDALILLGRILIAILFIPSGVNKLIGFSGTVGYLTNLGAPMPEVAAAVAVACELGVGLMVLFGWKFRFAALVLAVFTVGTALIAHRFWAVPDAQMAMQKINFMKNLAICGGLLFAWASGPGRWSIDKR